MVATDRISAFDVVLPKGILSKDRCWTRLQPSSSMPPPTSAPIGKQPPPTYGNRGRNVRRLPWLRWLYAAICGSAWRAYKSGVREICGVSCPEGMKENQNSPNPFITPDHKAEIGEHDADISKEEILCQRHGHSQKRQFWKNIQWRSSNAVRKSLQNAAWFSSTPSTNSGKAQRHYLPDGRNPHRTPARDFCSEDYEERLPKANRKSFQKNSCEWLMDNGFRAKRDSRFRKWPTKSWLPSANVTSSCTRHHRREVR